MAIRIAVVAFGRAERAFVSAACDGKMQGATDANASPAQKIARTDTRIYPSSQIAAAIVAIEARRVAAISPQGCNARPQMRAIVPTPKMKLISPGCISRLAGMSSEQAASAEPPNRSAK